jgi:glutathione peroxidase-family protein
MSEKKEAGPHFKYLEVKMPPKGQELKIKHNLKVDDIIGVNVMIVNKTSQNMIMRSQVDLISQKVLYNWYVDKDFFVLIRPNNVRNNI